MNPPGLRHPAIELLARYRAVWRSVWAMRHELAGPSRLADEAAFLPAALSLQETPVHPAPRRAMAVIAGLFVLALLWSCLGRLDVVAVASGRIVVSGQTKLIQPLETAVVRQILVKDGEHVRAGQVLLALDATVAQADQSSVTEQLQAAQDEAIRSEALLGGLRSHHPPVASGGPASQALLQAEWNDITARQARLDAETARREAELQTAASALAKLQAMLPLVQQREADLQALSQQGFISGHALQDRSRERIELERDLATQQARQHEARAALAESRQARAAFQAETVRSLGDRLAQARLKAAQLQQDQRKAAQRQNLTQLTAPVDGMVQQLAVHTPGGVVTAAQPLLVIVPDQASVLAEVVLENKDVGFVREGQAAEVKLETFPFTRYGTVPAQVRTITADAVNDEHRGAVFPVTLALDRTTLEVEGRPIRLAPGMNLTAEIKTGRRRVIEYLLAPLVGTAQEAARER